MAAEIATIALAIVSVTIAVAAVWLRQRADDAADESASLLDLTRSTASQRVLIDEVRRAVAAELDRVGSFQLRIGDELKSVTATSRELQRELHAQIAARGGATGLSPGDNPIREISHSLGTPLARLRADADLLVVDSSLPDHLRERVARMALAVDLCQAFLFAFRRLGVGGEKGPVFASDRLDELVPSLGNLFAAACEKQIGAHGKELPHAIHGYSNGFILVTLAPLLENAVEASPENGNVEVSFRSYDARHILTVANTATGAEAKIALESEPSSKPGHEGLGLPTVRRLLASVGGQLRHNVNGSDVSLMVELPVVEK